MRIASIPLCFVLLGSMACMDPAPNAPRPERQPDPERWTRDFMGVNQPLPDEQFFDTDRAPGMSEELGGAMSPGSVRTPATVTDEFPRKFATDPPGQFGPDQPWEL